MNLLTRIMNHGRTKTLVGLSRLLLAMFLLGVVGVSPAPASGIPQLGVYNGNTASALDTYAAWLNTPNMWGETGIGISTSWTVIESPASVLDPYITWVKAQPARRLFISVPMIPGWVDSGTHIGYPATGMSLAAGANGDYDSHFQLFAQYLVTKGAVNQVIIRLGHEYNGYWYPWRAKPDPTHWLTYYQKIVTAMRVTAPGLQFCFNPATGAQELADPTSVYPGDTYVNYVALDTYDECFVANTYPYGAPGTTPTDATRQANAWNIYLNGSYGIASWYAFSRTHNKPFGFAEWGVSDASFGGQDNPYFIGQMYNFMNTRPIAFACYFEYPQGAHHQLHSSIADYFPFSTYAFLRLFGNTTIIDNITNAADAGAVTTTGAWTSSVGVPRFYGDDYLLDDASGGGMSLTFTPNLQTDGDYQAFARWTASANRASNVPFSILAGGTTYPLSVNQRINGSQWTSLGIYPFAAGTGGKITIGNTGANGYVVGDAVQFIRVLPKPWINDDIGAVGATGSTSCTNGAFTVAGAGADIWGTADAFQYVYQTGSGDCSIFARVATQQNTSASAKTGLMIRETAAAGAKQVDVLVTPGGGVVLQYRSTTNGTTAQVTTVTGTAPTWLRLDRVASTNTFTAYKSSDTAIYPETVTWTQVGTVTVTMASSVSIGLAQSSHISGTLGTSTFDNVVVTP